METVNEKDYEYANHVGYKLINKMDWEGMYQKTNSASTRNQSPVLVAVMGSYKKMPLQVKIYVHSKNGIWTDLSDLLVKIGEAVYSHSFVRTLEMEKRCLFVCLCEWRPFPLYRGREHQG